MRRLAMMVGMVMLLVVVAAGVALAVTKTCNDIPCKGTDNEDVLHERKGTVKDAIYGYKAHDVLDANNFSHERDRLYGADQGDKLLANDRDSRDVLQGRHGSRPLLRRHGRSVRELRSAENKPRRGPR